jgi:hypothetical protein
LSRATASSGVSRCAGGQKPKGLYRANLEVLQRPQQSGPAGTCRVCRDCAVTPPTIAVFCGVTR